jgi:peptide/nickel transport system substrate-binding protein
MVDLYGRNATLLRSLLPAGAFSYVAGGADEAESFLDTLPQYEFDLAQARDELAQSRYADGLEFELTYITGAAWSKLSALNLEQNLKQIGVDVKLRAVSNAQWGATIVGHRDLGMQLMEGFSAPPDPNGGLVHVVGRETAVENSYNTSNWTTPEVETARDTLINSGDQAARYEATKTILSQIQEQLPYVPLYSPELVVAVGGGFGFAELPTQLDLTSGAWVSKLTYN